MQIQEPDSIRINKFLADAGVCSRREADKLIQLKKIKINGRTAVLGDKVSPADTITAFGKPVKPQTQKIYIALHKPFGAITTTDKTANNTVLDYIDLEDRIFPVGRLDVESSGIILLTNDGEVVNRLLKSKNRIEKEYLVTVDKPLTSQTLTRLAEGVKLDNKKTLPAKVEKISPNQFKITIIQGLTRQIRRMCEAVGYRVKILKRIKFAGIGLDELKRGKWRYLTPAEIALIKK